MKEYLFQLHDTFSNIKTTSKLFFNEHINLFMFFKLQNVETRYSNSKRKCFVIVKCLTKIKWIIIKSKYFIMIYIDHETLKSIFVINQTKKEWIVTWLNRLKKYDIQFHHKSFKNQHINITNDLNRIFIWYTSQNKIELFDCLTMLVLH